MVNWITLVMNITLNPLTDGGPGHLSTDGGGADDRPPGDLEN